MEQVNILQRTGVTPTIEMFTLILDMLITENRHKDSNDLWIRMHWEECQLNTDSFTTIMKLCSKTGSLRYHFLFLFRIDWLVSPLYSDNFPLDLSHAPFLSCSTRTHTGSPERAFFYLDEMRALHIKPDERTFAHVFRACAEVT